MNSMKVQNIVEWFWLIVKYTLAGLSIALIIRGFFLIPVPVEGISMQNTLTQGDFVLMEKFSDIERFDVIVFQMADGTTYIKRVIGMPGDTVSYRNDQLYINEEVVEETFLEENLAHDEERIPFTNDFEFEELMGVKKLGTGSYFVLGDNRRMSKDSRSFGAISEENIIGKARIVYYPLKRAHFV
ncbi:signal peptidase I [Enterococcus eurekensis]|uniref:Signal peptidase I n=2 Tax=Enterococcus TaxID=1350 RepID=A0ABV9M7Y3_9ENTE|nr:signal peptidase I [Candidatus Enterococcus avicola]